MASATDIITYVGIPLAVLGVLPILYTFALAILTQRRIRHSLLHYGHKPRSTARPSDGFTIRSSPMTSLIEVELPCYTIAPLERGAEDYWRTSERKQDLDEEHQRLLERSPTTLSMAEEGHVRGFLRGGSWRAFHWKKLLVGRKLYRIQYEDELREPPAEIDFTDLVHFLLDWGAVPDPMGWEKLKAGGLWTPGGTVLLRKPKDENDSQKKHVDWVLRSSMPDESDGILSLAIRWTQDMENVSEIRGAASLPPGWGRLVQPPSLHSEEKLGQGRVDLPARIENAKLANKRSLDSTSFRFRVEDGLVRKALWENKNVETGFIDEPFHAHPNSAGALWFTCAASSILANQRPGAGLWGFDLPSEISSFISKDAVPCGIMVLLGFLDEMDVPDWSSERSTVQHQLANNLASKHARRFQAQQAAQRLEAAMPPDQARVHKAHRESEQRRQQHEEWMQSIADREEREDRKVKEAISSPRMRNKAIAEACLSWLIGQGEIGREWTVEQLAQAVLYLLVSDQSEEGEGTRVIKVLEEWVSWTTAGGMKKQQVAMLDQMKVEFCFAASIVATIQENSMTGLGKAGADMLECLRLWRKVRLG